MKCGNCGAPCKLDAELCEHCEQPIFPNSLASYAQVDPDRLKEYLNAIEVLADQDPHNAKAMLTLGLSYLETGAYALAQPQFEQVIKTAPRDPQAYYYYALAKIGGRRLMTLSLSEARQLEEYLNTAIQFDREAEAPQYRLLLAMLKRDYYEKNGMKVPPPSAEGLLQDISGKTIDDVEHEHLIKSVKVSGIEEYKF